MKEDTDAPDPADQAAQQAAPPAPSPTPIVMPSPEGSNPLNPPPSPSPVVTSSPANTSTQQVSADPPPDFVKAVDNALQGRLGITKYGLIPAADKKALIAKIWQDPSIQTYYTTNQAILTKDVNAAGQFGNLINSVMMGQGNDPTVAVDYTNMLQAAGVPLTATEQAGLAGATQAVNAPVPRPFGTNTVSGYDYGAPMPAGGWTGTGESFGWRTHMGVDYGTRPGDRIVSPFAGTVTVETGVAGFGNIVYVTLDNGWKMGFGHVAQGEVQNGQRVNPGDLIALAGQNVGSAQGSVTIVTWQDPNGKYVNPHDALDPIFAGTTFSALGAPGAAGTGMPTVNKVLDAEYPSIKSDFQTFFGHPPSPEDVYDILQHGSSPAQWLDYIRAMPGPVPNMTQGQYYDMRQVVDQVSTKILGHPGTASIVQELRDQNITSPTAVTNWYNVNGVTGVPESDYNAIHKAQAPTMCGIFSECGGGADPRDIQKIHQKHLDEQAASGHGAIA